MHKRKNSIDLIITNYHPVIKIILITQIIKHQRIIILWVTFKAQEQKSSHQLSILMNHFLITTSSHPVTYNLMLTQKVYFKVKLTVIHKAHKISIPTIRNKYELYKKLSIHNIKLFLMSSRTISSKLLRKRFKCNWKNLNNQLHSNR